jgi:hypothetical protein
MNFIPRPISQHHRARLIAWTLSMLLWTFQALFAAALSPHHERQRRERMSLTWLTQQVKLLIISRAGDLAHTRMRRRQRISYRGCRNVLKTGFVKAIIGARIRRLLNRKALVERIAALIDALRHVDDHAALVAKRLRRGLTRRCLQLFALPPASDAAIITLAARHAIGADSS